MPTGLECNPICAQVRISKSSSKVPNPPGRAMNASPISAIAALRSCMEATTRSSVRRLCARARVLKLLGMIPITCPPASIAASATAPIRPVPPPPKITVTPHRVARSTVNAYPAQAARSAFLPLAALPGLNLSQGELQLQLVAQRDAVPPHLGDLGQGSQGQES